MNPPEPEKNPHFDPNYKMPPELRNVNSEERIEVSDIDFGDGNLGGNFKYELLTDYLPYLVAIAFGLFLRQYQLWPDTTPRMKGSSELFIGMVLGYLTGFATKEILMGRTWAGLKILLLLQLVIGLIIFLWQYGFLK